MKDTLSTALIQEVTDKQLNDVLKAIGRNIDTFAAVHPLNPIIFSSYIALIEALKHTIRATEITATDSNQAVEVKNFLIFLAHTALDEETVSHG